MWIGIKQRRKRRAGREGGEDEKTGSEIRFLLVTALYFPCQQARGSRQTWFNPKCANRRQSDCMCVSECGYTKQEEK